MLRYSDWIDCLKVGDPAVYSLNGKRTLTSVTKITKTQVVTPVARFHRLKGYCYSHGDEVGGGGVLVQLKEGEAHG